MSGKDGNDARRDALYAKRDALRAAQAARMEQRRREELVARFERWHGGYLAEAGIAHELLWDWDAPPPGPLATYAFAFSGIDWRHVPEGVTEAGAYPPFVQALFDDAFAALGVAPARRVHVDWSSGSMPRLVLQAGDLVRHAAELVGWGWDLWVFDPDATWIVEVYHEGTLSYAPRPGAPEHAGHGVKRRR